MSSEFSISKLVKYRFYTECTIINFKHCIETKLSDILNNILNVSLKFFAHIG